MHTLNICVHDFYSIFAGPENWYKNTDANYKACKRHHQSPIDIDDSIVEHDAALTPFNLKGYDNDAVVTGQELHTYKQWPFK